MGMCGLNVDFMWAVGELGGWGGELKDRIRTEDKWVYCNTLGNSLSPPIRAKRAAAALATNLWPDTRSRTPFAEHKRPIYTGLGVWRSVDCASHFSDYRLRFENTVQTEEHDGRV